MAEVGMSSFTSSEDDMRGVEEFILFKTQLFKVQDFVQEYNNKIIDKTLDSDDITKLDIEMKCLMECEQNLTSDKMKASYVAYKALALKMIQESYRICNWLLENHCSKMDNIFDIETYVDKIIESFDEKEDPLGHINTLFHVAFKNMHSFNLSFYSNIKLEEAESEVITQSKKEFRKSQKRQLEDLVVPDEVGSENGNNELQITLLKVKNCLKKAVSDNQGNPVSFHKFAIDPFSLTFTVENLFNLASLMKDGVVKIERDSDDVNSEFSTITLAKKKSTHAKSKEDDTISTLFTMNHELWQHYVKKYRITKSMIVQE